MKHHAKKLRFTFGKNWSSFSEKALTPERIVSAREAFSCLFKGIELSGKTFLDIGFGQGLSLLIARENGCRVMGIDIDPLNAGALKTTMEKMGLSEGPEIEITSILDGETVLDLKKKGPFDIVHSWGVLHHTGNMAMALENALSLVKPQGFFVCAIYNRHWSSPFWRHIKMAYNRSPVLLQKGMVLVFYPVIFVAKWLVTGKDPYHKERGMDFFHDVVDWIGGYPYEYASVDEVVDRMAVKGFSCLRIHRAATPTGCNEFVFQRRP